MTRSSSLFLLLSVVFASLVSGLTPAQWRSQSIYQVLTDRFGRPDSSTTACSDLNSYCGGTWQGLINHLDYIQGMGFTAIWISPVVKNPIGETSDGDSYHGYWAQDAYAVNSKFGTKSDLVALSAALHARGMYLMVDVVPNHMGSESTIANIDYSKFNPFNSQSYFHSSCSIDYSSDTSVKQCWVSNDNTVPLPDLRTENTNVRNMWNTWIASLVSNYSIDGLRIDTARQIETGFWAGFQSAAGGIHTLGEVWVQAPSDMCPYQNYLNGLLNYPTWYYITGAFQSTSGSISNLVNGINTMKSTCKDVTLLGSFLENHDNVRFPSLTSDTSLIKNAIAFTILQDGIPIIYQGQEQKFSGGGVPNNREDLWRSGYSTTSTLYTHIKALNKIRSWAASLDSAYVTYNAWPIYSDSQDIVLRKGNTGKQIISAYTNRGASSSSASITISGANSGFTSGQGITEVLACGTYTAGTSGNLAVTFTSGLPLVLFPTSALSGSGICGH